MINSEVQNVMKSSRLKKKGLKLTNTKVYNSQHAYARK
jgi:hypothetical protein